MKITSRDNSLLRRARAVRDGEIDELIFVEGLRLCEEALSSGLKIQAVIYSEEIARKERATQLIARKAARLNLLYQDPPGHRPFGSAPRRRRSELQIQSARLATTGRHARHQQSCERWRDSAHGGSRRRDRRDRGREHVQSIFTKSSAWRDGFGVSSADLERAGLCRRDRLVRGTRHSHYRRQRSGPQVFY